MWTQDSTDKAGALNAIQTEREVWMVVDWGDNGALTNEYEGPNFWEDPRVVEVLGGEDGECVPMTPSEATRLIELADQLAPGRSLFAILTHEEAIEDGWIEEEE